MYLDCVPLAFIFAELFLNLLCLMLEGMLLLVQSHLLRHDIFELFLDTLFFLFGFLNVEDQRRKVRNANK
jgi:positive regulator of sigma E activity